MNFVQLIFLLLGAVVSAFFILFSISSFYEKKFRAALIGFICLVVFVTFWFGGFYFFSPVDIALIIASSVLVILVLLYFIPLGTITPLKVGVIEKRVDERDTMFAREEYLPGTEKYDKYYAMRPWNKDVDDKIRSLPELLAPGGRFYDLQRSEAIDKIFSDIENMTTEVDGEVTKPPENIECAESTNMVKERLYRAGADDVGIAELNPMFVYSHVGRGPEKWGTPIENNHRYVIVFVLEMDYAKVEDAPRIAININRPGEIHTFQRLLNQGAYLREQLSGHHAGGGMGCRFG